MAGTLRMTRTDQSRRTSDRSSIHRRSFIFRQKRTTAIDADIPPVPASDNISGKGRSPTLREDSSNRAGSVNRSITESSEMRRTTRRWRTFYESICHMSRMWIKVCRRVRR